jgi:transporter family-2 protein
VNALLGLFVVVMGAGLSVQPLLNARVGGALGHPVYAAMFSVLVSTVSMLVLAVILRLDPPDLRGLGNLPPWMLTGGIIGAFVVLAALSATPKLGAAATVALFIGGQLAMSLVVDQYGLLGVPQRPLDISRVIGVICLVAGVVLIRWR